MGSLRSIPPIKNEGNAIGRMLVSVIDSLSKYHFVTISNWHPDLVKLEYNKSKYLHTKHITYIPDLVSKMYPKLDSRLIKAAGRSVLAHLLHMEELGSVKLLEDSKELGWILSK